MPLRDLVHRRVRRWGPELRGLAALLVLACLAWGFVELTDEVVEGDTHAVDEWLLKALREDDDPSKLIGPPWVAESARDLTALGSLSVLGLLVVIAALGLVLARRLRTAAVLVVSAAGGAAVSYGLKLIFARPRPQVVPQLMETYTPSFPSGHALVATVVYLTLGAILARSVNGRRLRIFCLAVAFLLTLIVGASRVFLGVHFPTDVLAGWMAGLTWALLVALVVRALQRRGAVEARGGEEAPQAESD